MFVPKSFTQDYPLIVNRLHTSCGVSKSFSPAVNPMGKHPKIEYFTGLWDTGATNSVINKSVADKLGLYPTGITRVYHAGGENFANTYLVNIILPNDVGVSSVRVSEGIIEGADVLIGMDIISKGDFSICTSAGCTRFSFKMPSTHNHDYVREDIDNYHTPVVKEDVPRRNDPCRCGSGKKYKNCCMDK